MSQSPEPGNFNVNVSIQAIIQQLHKRYGAQLANLMQEVAELQCATEAQSAELAELRAKFRAQAGAGFPASGPDGVYDDLLRAHPTIDLGSRVSGTAGTDPAQA